MRSHFRTFHFSIKGPYSYCAIQYVSVLFYSLLERLYLKVVYFSHLQNIFCYLLLPFVCIIANVFEVSCVFQLICYIHLRGYIFLSSLKWNLYFLLLVSFLFHIVRFKAAIFSISVSLFFHKMKSRLFRQIFSCIVFWILQKTLLHIYVLILLFSNPTYFFMSVKLYFPDFTIFMGSASWVQILVDAVVFTFVQIVLKKAWTHLFSPHQRSVKYQAILGSLAFVGRPI